MRGEGSIFKVGADKFMLDEQNGITSNIFKDLSKEIETIDIKKDIVNTGNSLILALEDMIESLENTKENSKNSIVSDYKSNKALSLNEIKDKLGTIKKLFKDLQVKLKFNSVRNLDGQDMDIKNFQMQVENYVDETLTDWLLISETNRAIDCTHDICYRIRELLRKLERNKNS